MTIFQTLGLIFVIGGIISALSKRSPKVTFVFIELTLLTLALESFIVTHYYVSGIILLITVAMGPYFARKRLKSKA